VKKHRITIIAKYGKALVNSASATCNRMSAFIRKIIFVFRIPEGQEELQIIYANIRV